MTSLGCQSSDAPSGGIARIVIVRKCSGSRYGFTANVSVAFPGFGFGRGNFAGLAPSASSCRVTGVDAGRPFFACSYRPSVIVAGSP